MASDARPKAKGGKPTARKIRVVLVDDHPVYREGLRAVLSAQADLDVVGEGTDSVSAYELIASLTPDVAVLDIALPGIHGVAIARELRLRAPDTKLLVLTAYTTGRFVDEAFAAGVSGYAQKSLPGDAIVDAIRTIARGGTYRASNIPYDAQSSSRTVAPAPHASPLDKLTRREREIFDLVVLGLSNEYTARRMHISVKTVETHRASINKKLNVHSTAELVRFAALRGLLVA